jgi:CO dehydrogenase maturation factor
MSKTIIVTGKGGTGKTTVSGLIIKYLKEHAKGPILALDADPDANLATVLGIEVNKTMGDLREDTLKEIKNLPAGMSKSNYIEMGLHEIIVETEKLDLVTMGRSEGPGCYCYINSLMRKFSDDIQESYEWVVMDNEAGLEHLSRRTASKVDHMIMVVNENPLAIDCARRIDKLVDDLQNDIANRYLLINAVRDERVKSVQNKIKDLGVECLGNIPVDPELDEYIFNGESVFKLNNTPAIRKIDEIMGRIIS